MRTISQPSSRLRAATAFLPRLPVEPVTTMRLRRAAMARLAAVALVWALRFLRLARRIDRGALGDRRHADVPPRAALHPFIGMGSDGDDIGAVRSARAFEGGLEFSDGRDVLRFRAHGPRVHGEIDAWRFAGPLGGGEEIVEFHAAFGRLQAVDDGEAAIIADDADDLVSGQNGRVNI